MAPNYRKPNCICSPLIAPSCQGECLFSCIPAYSSSSKLTSDNGAPELAPGVGFLWFRLVLHGGAGYRGDRWKSVDCNSHWHYQWNRQRNRVTVVMTARCMEKGRQVKESLLKENPTAKLHLMEMDLSSINSVISFTRSFYGANFPLNILINNAGVFGCPFQLSDDGVELQFATNYLGHFLLTNLLLDKLKSTAKETGVEGRIVNVSSIAHRFALSSTMELDKINDPSNYHRYGAYIRSKLAILLHASELTKLLKEEACNVTINSLHPGIVPTNICRNNNYFDSTVMFFIKPILKNVAQGASAICYIALHPKLKGISGKYFAADCNEISASKYASDEKLSKRLWDFSQELIGNIKKPI